MSAANGARTLPPASKSSVADASLFPLIDSPVAPAPYLVPKPVLRSAAPSSDAPRRFTRVPTHAVGVYPEQREYPRASLKLPLRLRSINHLVEEFPISLVTRNISSTGVYFLCPKPLAAGSPVELEIVLISRPLGRGNVVLTTRAHVQRIEPATVPGWYGVAASFDDVEFDRDDRIPYRYLKA